MDRNTGNNEVKKYYLVEASVLPEIFAKVVEAKRLLKLGKLKKINDAVKEVGISRSAYYKYKDYVFPFYDKTSDKIITFYAVLKDEPGVLSHLLNMISKAEANILTINQNIPIHGLAHISISVQTGNMKSHPDTLLRKLRMQTDIISIDIVASE